MSQTQHRVNLRLQLESQWLAGACEVGWARQVHSQLEPWRCQECWGLESGPRWAGSPWIRLHSMCHQACPGRRRRNLLRWQVWGPCTRIHSQTLQELEEWNLSNQYNETSFKRSSLWTYGQSTYHLTSCRRRRNLEENGDQKQLQMLRSEQERRGGRREQPCLVIVKGKRKLKASFLCRWLQEMGIYKDIEMEEDFSYENKFSTWSDTLLNKWDCFILNILTTNEAVINMNATQFYWGMTEWN